MPLAPPAEEREGHWNAPAPMSFADQHGAMHDPLLASESVTIPLTGAAVRLHDT